METFARRERFPQVAAYPVHTVHGTGAGLQQQAVIIRPGQVTRPVVFVQVIKAPQIPAQPRKIQGQARLQAQALQGRKNRQGAGQIRQLQQAFQRVQTPAAVAVLRPVIHGGKLVQGFIIGACIEDVQKSRQVNRLRVGKYALSARDPQGPAAQTG